MASIKQDNKQFRKGVVLGLTMAEVFLLLIFLLLMISAVKIKEEKIQVKKAIFERDQAKADYLELSEISELKKMPKEQFDITKEYVKIKAESETQKEELKKVASLKQILDSKKEVNSETLLKTLENGSKLETLARELVPESEQQKAVEDTLQLAKLGSALNGEKKDMAQILAEKRALEDELENIRGRNENLTAQMKSEGRSVDLPPCWPDSNGKWGDSIFKVDLTNGGITLFDIAPPSRLEQINRLPLENVKYNTLLTISAFRNQTTPLLKWSNEHQCRFLVSIEDKTGQHDKDTYKRLLSTVEDHFYKRFISTRRQASVSPKVETPSGIKEDPRIVNETIEEKGWLENIIGTKPNRKRKLN